jgi:hypothetical protein
MFMLKNKLMNVVLITGIVSVILLGIASNSHAWRVTVTNGSDRPCIVLFYDNAYIVNDWQYRETIQPSQSITLDSKGYCFSGLEGFYFPPDGREVKIASTSILGHEVDVGGFSAGCWDSSWTICRKRGAGDPNVRDNDYGFCKQ